MKTLLRFLKPYKALCFFTLLVMTLDVVGALYIPTLVADMINIGIGGGDMGLILQKGALMLVMALLSRRGDASGQLPLRAPVLQAGPGYEKRPL